MTIAHERRVELAESFNFRDLGGYPTTEGRTVRWRMLFRSDALHRLTADDITRLGDLGLRMVFDLRSSHEIEHQGLGTLYEHGIIHTHVPFNPTIGASEDRPREGDAAERYQAMLERAQPAIKDIFGALAESHAYPAVFHCYAGKDRTGMIGALILGTLGVPDEDIVADYVLTDRYMPDRLEALRASGDMDIYRMHVQNIPAGGLGAHPETMTRLLAMLTDRYGSTKEFILQCGVTESQIEQLAGNLLES